MKVKITKINEDWSTPSLAEAGYKVGEIREVEPEYYRNELSSFWDEGRQMTIFLDECEVLDD